ncbi:cytochrome P450 [Roseateles amylovorans]|uniref:Cytochrome P450 n=1 Tax=Roseateles amylovorans TaxID=2978473 RepID=A0ABY6AXI1_9BURK|nr:cytochrome P450 [Roseateles amylovorans]UXH77894.1 cytochrome P450 [Roseateles amylovorans]
MPTPMPAPTTTAPLHDPDLLMRPPGEPLPPSLASQGGPLADVFQRWLRQRDDPQHRPEKALLVLALDALTEDEIRTHARRQAAIARQGGWSHWHWAVPASTVASLSGLRITRLEDQRRLHDALRAIAAGLAADADAGAVQLAGEAVDALLGALDAAEQQSPEAPLQALLHVHAPPSQWTDRTVFNANRLALIWQSHEAGAALTGHALLAMRAGITPHSGAQAPSLDGLMAIARDGGAVRHTRRFRRGTDRASDPASEDPIARGLGPGAAPTVGEAVTVALAGTEHPFGDGPHRCPGQRLALTSIHAALAWLCEQPGLRWPAPIDPLSLPNMQIPQFPPLAMTMHPHEAAP